MLQFTRPKNSTVSRFRNTVEALEAEVSSCVIDLRNIANYFEDQDPELYYRGFVQKFYEEGRVMGPYSPEAIFKISKNEQIFEIKDNGEREPVNKPFYLGKRNFAVGVMERDRNGKLYCSRLSTLKNIDNRFMRTQLSMNDFLIWNLYNYIMRMVTEENDGYFHEGDYVAPLLNDYVLAFQEGYQSLYDSIGDYKTRQELKTIERRTTIEKYFTPFNAIKVPLTRWIFDDNEGMNIISVELTEMHMVVKKGVDARIVAYHAMKEGIKPRCILGLL